MWKNKVVRQATEDNIIQRMRSACWINKIADTHSLYEMLIAFPMQQWTRECISVIRYTHISSIVSNTRLFTVVPAQIVRM
jgi:hypothetical protein